MHNDATARDRAAVGLLELLDIMARLRDPQGGCPWDLEQTFRSIVPHTLEEAYEVADAIERDDIQELEKELGDLLFQVVFYARLAEEQGRFDFAEVVTAICAKLVRRHPHVFGNHQVGSAQEQTRQWEEHKARERQAGPAGEGHRLLDDVPLTLPALSRAAKLQRRAARVGMDWRDHRGVWAKLVEEMDELEARLEEPGEAREAELGDLLFTCVNLARHLDIDPEQALRCANRKFEDRVGYIEAALEATGQTWEDTAFERLEALWQASKIREE